MSMIQYQLGEVITQKQEPAPIDPNNSYRLIKLRLYQKGAELREIKLGLELGSKQFLAKQGQFIISKIDARNGAMAIVPESLDNAVVTGDFLLFDFNQEIVEPKYFDFYSRISDFDRICKQCSEGSTNRVRLKVDKFLNHTISLPSIPEQKRIVSKLESVEPRIKKIKTLRNAQQKEIQNFLFSKYTDVIRQSVWAPMIEVAPIVRREVQIEEKSSYPELGIRSFGKGTFHKTSLSGFEVGTKTLYRISKGDLMFSNVFAWEGAITVAKEMDDNRFGSHRFISCVVKSEKAIAEFLCYHFLTPKGLEDINHASPGGAGRNKTLGLEKLMRIKVPIPDVNLQREFVDLLLKIEVLRQGQRQTDLELDELMPSLFDKAFKGEL